MTENQAQQALTGALVSIARLESDVMHLAQSVDELKESNRQQTIKIDKVLLALSEARGGWRTMMLVGGAASSIGAGFAWVASHWKP